MTILKALFLSLIILCASCESECREPAEPPPVTWTECGGMIGDHPCNFSFKDQNGDDWELYGHMGSVIVLDFSSMWCGYCKVAAADVQSMMDTYGSKNFIWVTVLIEDSSGNSVSVNEASRWAKEYGIKSAPVLAADHSIVDFSAEAGFPVSGWPTMAVINREMIITQGLTGWSKQQLVEWIENEVSH